MLRAISLFSCCLPSGRRLARLAVLVALTLGLALGGLRPLAPTPAMANVPIYTTADLNVRSCPSTTCAVISVIPQGQCVIGIAWAEGRTWVKVRHQGRIGFVYVEYVRRGC